MSYSYNCKMTEDFIIRAIEKHGDRYDYSNVIYKKAKEKVIIICKKHGYFLQAPANHLQGYGCSNCYGKKNTGGFIQEANAIHGDDFDYSKVNYINVKTCVTIICNKCMHEFEQISGKHLKGAGCPLCSSGRRKKKSS